MENICYAEIRKVIDDNHGCSSEIIKANQLVFDKYLAVMNEIKTFHNKRVEISYTHSNDFLSSAGKKIGKIKVIEDRIRFYEGRKRSRFYYLDAGLYEGFYAVLIFKEVNAL